MVCRRREIRSTPDDWKAAGRDRLLAMLHHLNLIRAFEEFATDRQGRAWSHGPAHSSIGQEGGAVGAMAALTKTDQINGSHRAHHQFLAKALRAVLEGRAADPLATQEDEAVPDLYIAAKEDRARLEPGLPFGRGGSMHLRWAEAGVTGTNAIVGGGAFAGAFSRKMQGKDDVMVTFFGDGAVHIGSVSETMNLAAAWKLLICFFIENNAIAVATHPDEVTAETRLSSRDRQHSVLPRRRDGPAGHHAGDGGGDGDHAGNGPTVIEAVCYRYFHQNGPLPGSAGYRTKEDEAAWRVRDPIDRMVREMKAQGFLTDADAELIRERLVETMAVSWAR